MDNNIYIYIYIYIIVAIDVQLNESVFPFVSPYIYLPTNLSYHIIVEQNQLINIEVDTSCEDYKHENSEVVGPSL